NQKHYRANADSPVFAELRGLVLKTVGLVEPLRAALEPLSKEIRAAFVFGSVAQGSDRAGSDVDLLVLGERISHGDLYEALHGAEDVLARSVNPTVVTPSEWQRRTKDDSFLRRVADRPKLFVIGSEDDLP
ncbi:MAG TPA: nucleotidyltransferase domain-containing protein, partial [Thermoanaerobaculia bacterium]|nr:nucleotidyltransferase domain-containing protein [Thermoanaerobaculia bacterium]